MLYNLFLLSAIILLIILLVSLVKKHKQAKVIAEIIGIFASVGAYLFSIYIFGKQEQECSQANVNTSTEKISSEIEVVSNSEVSIGDISNSHDININVNENGTIDKSSTYITNNILIENGFGSMSDETLLRYAQKLCDAQDYKEAIQIYELDRLENNVIALTNLGYMYANGIYVNQDFEKAKKYYDRAIEMGYEKALTNELAMCFNNKLEWTPDVLIEGFKQKNLIAGKFVYSRFEEADLNDEEACIGSLWELAMLWVDERKEEGSDSPVPKYIEDIYYRWEYEGVVQSRLTARSDELTMYVLISSMDELNLSEGTANISKTYKCYKSKCIDIDMLDESFDNID